MTSVNHAPRFSPARAEALAREAFGLEARAAALPSERDLNFLLTAADGRRFVLKFANRSEDHAVLELQNAAMLHLAAQPDAPPCSRVLPDAKGAFLTPVADEDGAPSAMRLVTFIEGVPLGRVRPQPPGLLADLGRFLGRLSRGLADFRHPAARRSLVWDLRTGVATVAEHLPLIADGPRRELVRGLLARYDAPLRARLEALDRGVVHNDANDFNVIVAPPAPDGALTEARSVAGLIDFGDMIHSWRLAEPAVACAYALLAKDDPLAAAARVAAGYHAVAPLSDAELEALFPLILLRLLMSVAICAYQTDLRPDNAYLAISNEPAWEALTRLAGVDFRFALCVLRAACGKPAHPDAPQFEAWLRSAAGSFAPVAGAPLSEMRPLTLDLSVGSPMIDDPDVAADTASFTALVFGEMKRAGAAVGVGRYDEARLVYAAAAFRPPGRPLAEGRTVHLGVDLFLGPGSPVFAPLDGTVLSVRDNAARLDYGPTVILEHRAGAEGPRFFTLYGHLDPGVLCALKAGAGVRRGERIAAVGAPPRNGDWPPHLHFQIILDLLGLEGDFPGVACASERDVWLGLCPDPGPMLGLPPDPSDGRGMAKADIHARRSALLGPSLSVSYRRPLEIVRGFRQWLYDETGRAFLDGVNNVAHVGHSHPRVVDAVRRQVAILNTNTRYLHPAIVCYAERLTALLPAPLSVCFFVNSGSEANDLALRLARTFTGRRDMIAVDGAYHGHLTSLIEISPYKFDGPGGSGRPPHTQVAVLPDLYRGPYRAGDAAAGAKYAAHVRDAVARVRCEGREPAGFICESLLSCGGQIVLPDGYLAEAFRAVREAGGVCIADEVQVGFGRVGTHFWGFETQGVVPDIVTMGKPIGNGFPLAAVVTTPEIAAAFANGMEYFNTYGGNPVACAAGLAVLDIMRDEGLQARAAAVGARLKAGLERVMRKRPIVGDVRGMGLFLGVELVRDRASRAPARREAEYVVNRLRDRSILISAEGPDHNVLKIKPPLAFEVDDADRLAEALEDVLAEDPVARRDEEEPC